MSCMIRVVAEVITSIDRVKAGRPQVRLLLKLMTLDANRSCQFQTADLTVHRINEGELTAEGTFMHRHISVNKTRPVRHIDLRRDIDGKSKPPFCLRDS